MSSWSKTPTAWFSGDDCYGCCTESASFLTRHALGIVAGRSKKGKGCDIGYAPATSSCEGASSVETCTVAAFDAITAFAVPNPNCSSQSQLVFSGLAALRVASPSASPSLLRISNF